MKGVSEVIAIILILMITISLAGLAYMFMSTTMSDVTSSAGSTVDSTTSSMLTSFVIESISQGRTYIRNTGQTALTGLSVYLNDENVNFSAPSSISPGEVGVLNITGIIFGGDTVRVTSSNGVSASKPASAEWYGAACYWKFDEGSGTSVYDSSAFGRNGTMYNGPAWTTGRYGNAVLFDGTNDYINTNYNQDYSGRYQITVSLWVRPARTYASEPSVWYYFTTKSNAPFEFGYQGWDDSVTFKPYNATSASFGVGVSRALQSGSWYHYVGVVNGPFVGLYENGVLVASRSDFAGSLINNAYNLLIGGHSGGGNFNGTIDDLAVWDRALTAQEILKLYNKAV